MMTHSLSAALGKLENYMLRYIFRSWLIFSASACSVCTDAWVWLEGKNMITWQESVFVVFVYLCFCWDAWVCLKMISRQESEGKGCLAFCYSSRASADVAPTEREIRRRRLTSQSKKTKDFLMSQSKKTKSLLTSQPKNTKGFLTSRSKKTKGFLTSQSKWILLPLFFWLSLCGLDC